MDEQTLKYLFTLPPEEIVKWFQSKGLITSWSWRDVWQDAHNRAFTVAKGMDLDVLQSIKDEVDKIFSHGLTYEQFRKDLEPTLKRLGWWGKVKASDVPGYDPNSGIDPDSMVQLGSPRRLRTIFTVNSSVAYNAGRWKSFMENVANMPYLQYHQLDRKTKRKAHVFFDEKIFRFDDPIWDIIAPPSDWNCGCYLTAHSESEVADSKDLILLNMPEHMDLMELAKLKIPREWQYNPGKTMFKPDLNNYDRNLAAAYNNAINTAIHGGG